MFRFFKKKTSDDFLLEHIKKVNKKIARGKGGCIQVCRDFLHSTANNDLYKNIGFFNSSEIKHNQVEIMYSAVILLALLKTKKINDEDGLVLQLAETTFVLSSLIVDENEMKSILLITGAAHFIEKREALLEKHKSAWNDWLNINPNLLTKIAML
jgi:hypothetical protein